MRNRSEEERSVTRWNPGFGNGSRDPFERLFRWAGMLDDYDTARSSQMMMPRLDVEEDDDSYEVSVELPGMKQEDVQIELNQNVLTITGEKRSSFDDRGERRGEEGGKFEKPERVEKSEKRQRRSRWSERSYGRFTRSFTLPSDADTDRMEARFSNGVLAISIPKSEAAKPRTIQITR
jgi:HSP20 family protein